MNALKMFLLGMLEFRLSFTTNPGEYDLAYETGREWAHRLTFRRFEN